MKKNTAKDVMQDKKPEVKDVMLPHSLAKVAFYRAYLERFLSVMSWMEYCQRVNIYDVFCGRGIYSDGNHGSPIQAMEVIREIRQTRPSKKEFNLYLNDAVKSYVDGVEQYIEENFPEHNSLCNIHMLNMPADQLLEQIGRHLSYSDNSDYNLLFIDPYGYKDIHREALLKLLSNKHTDIMLFLPISFMHRFRNYAFSGTDDPKAKPLRDFISEFFRKGHPVTTDTEMDIHEYIQALTEAFSMGGRFFTTNYLIERDSKNYFAVFFISHNLRGLEKAVESMWELDKEEGCSFKQDRTGGQLALFEEAEKEDRRKARLEMLRMQLLVYLRKERFNADIYKFALRQGFKPSHARTILTDLEKSDVISCENCCIFDKPHKPGTYYLNYQSLQKPRLVFRLKQ